LFGTRTILEKAEEEEEEGNFGVKIERNSSLIVLQFVHFVRHFGALFCFWFCFVFLFSFLL